MSLMCSNGRALLAATVTDVGDGPWVYPACEQCYSKLTVSRLQHCQLYQCHNCRNTYNLCEENYRYRLCLTVTDSTALASVTAFGGMLNSFFGVTATEFHNTYVSAVRDKYGASCESILQVAVEQAFVGQRFLFGLKTSPSDIKQINVKCAGGFGNVCLKDISQSSNVSLQRSTTRHLPEFIAVQAVPQTDSAFSTTVVEYLQHLRTVIEDYHLTPDICKDRAALLQVLNSCPRHHESKDTFMSSSIMRNRIMTPAASPAYDITLNSSFDQSSVGFSCDSSLERLLEPESPSPIVFRHQCPEVTSACLSTSNISALSAYELRRTHRNKEKSVISSLLCPLDEHKKRQIKDSVRNKKLVWSEPVIEQIQRDFAELREPGSENTATFINSKAQIENEHLKKVTMVYSKSDLNRLDLVSPSDLDKYNQIQSRRYKCKSDHASGYCTNLDMNSDNKENISCDRRISTPRSVRNSWNKPEKRLFVSYTLGSTADTTLHHKVRTFKQQFSEKVGVHICDVNSGQGDLISTSPQTDFSGCAAETFGLSSSHKEKSIPDMTVPSQLQVYESSNDSLHLRHFHSDQSSVHSESCKESLCNLDNILNRQLDFGCSISFPSENTTNNDVKPPKRTESRKQLDLLRFSDKDSCLESSTAASSCHKARSGSQKENRLLEEALENCDNEWGMEVGEFLDDYPESEGLDLFLSKFNSSLVKDCEIVQSQKIKLEKKTDHVSMEKTDCYSVDSIFGDLGKMASPYQSTMSGNGHLNCVADGACRDLSFAAAKVNPSSTTVCNHADSLKKQCVSQNVRNPKKQSFSQKFYNTMKLPFSIKAVSLKKHALSQNANNLKKQNLQKIKNPVKQFLSTRNVNSQKKQTLSQNVDNPKKQTVHQNVNNPKKQTLSLKVENPKKQMWSQNDKNQKKQALPLEVENPFKQTLLQNVKTREKHTLSLEVEMHKKQILSQNVENPKQTLSQYVKGTNKQTLPINARKQKTQTLFQINQKKQTFVHNVENPEKETLSQNVKKTKKRTLKWAASTPKANYDEKTHIRDGESCISANVTLRRSKRKYHNEKLDNTNNKDMYAENVYCKDIGITELCSKNMNVEKLCSNKTNLIDCQTENDSALPHLDDWHTSEYILKLTDGLFSTNSVSCAKTYDKNFQNENTGNSEQVFQSWPSDRMSSVLGNGPCNSSFTQTWISQQQLTENKLSDLTNCAVFCGSCREKTDENLNILRYFSRQICSKSLTDSGALGNGLEKSGSDTGQLSYGKDNVTNRNDKNGCIAEIIEQNCHIAKITENNGHVAKIIEHNGRVAKITEQSGQVAKITEQSGQVAKITEQSGQVVKITEQSGQVAKITEQSGQVAKITEHSGQVAKITEQSGQVAKITEHSGHVVKITEQSGHVAEIVDQYNFRSSSLLGDACKVSEALFRNDEDGVTCAKVGSVSWDNTAHIQKSDIGMTKSLQEIEVCDLFLNSKADKSLVLRQQQISNYKCKNMLQHKDISTDMLNHCLSPRFNGESENVPSDSSVDLFSSQDESLNFAVDDMSVNGHCQQSKCGTVVQPSSLLHSSHTVSADHDGASSERLLKKSLSRRWTKKRVRFSDRKKEHYFISSDVISHLPVVNQVKMGLKSSLKRSSMEWEPSGSQDLFSEPSQDMTGANVSLAMEPGYHSPEDEWNSSRELFSQSPSMPRLPVINPPLTVCTVMCSETGLVLMKTDSPTVTSCREIAHAYVHPEVFKNDWSFDLFTPTPTDEASRTSSVSVMSPAVEFHLRVSPGDLTPVLKFCSEAYIRRAYTVIYRLKQNRILAVEAGVLYILQAAWFQRSQIRLVWEIDITNNPLSQFSQKTVMNKNVQ